MDGRKLWQQRVRTALHTTVTMCLSSRLLDLVRAWHATCHCLIVTPYPCVHGPPPVTVFHPYSSPFREPPSKKSKKSDSRKQDEFQVFIRSITGGSTTVTTTSDTTIYQLKQKYICAVRVVWSSGERAANAAVLCRLEMGSRWTAFASCLLVQCVVTQVAHH